jgi:hypothetical protein
VDPSEVAAGWVRLIGADGIRVSIRTSSVSQVLGPIGSDDGWMVQLGDDIGRAESVIFDSVAEAEMFVDDLLHDC